jgi:hypothetical protein
MLTRALLVCGVVSSLLYVAMNVVAPLGFPGYSVLAHTVSELSAIGAPTRAGWVPFGLLYAVLLIAFAWGIWRESNGRALRTIAVMLLVYGAVSLAWPFAPMHLRGSGLFTLTDTMHIAFAMATVALMFAAIGVSAFAFDKWFRWYAIATAAVLLWFGLLTTLDAPAVAANQPTPWIGLWERINIVVFLLWIVALAAMLLRKQISPVADTAV